MFHSVLVKSMEERMTQFPVSERDLRPIAAEVDWGNGRKLMLSVPPDEWEMVEEES